MIEDLKKELGKTLNEFKERLKEIRSHKLSLGFLENLEISLYHSKYPLKALCLISQIDPLTFRLEPYDPNSLKEIEIALLERKMGISVIKEKNSLLVKFPPLTEEAKKEIIKSLNNLKEEIRVKGRITRDEFLKRLKADKEEGKISEDYFYKTKENFDKEIDKFNQEVENIFKQKEKEILS
ncbi:MAG: ribosome-recycling factor [Candidatus Parcubacteria bacterium]|nr:MAG: ribosome-recycling factor [Candidatus Parcubacteria bacterium]